MGEVYRTYGMTYSLDDRELSIDTGTLTGIDGVSFVSDIPVRYLELLGSTRKAIAEFAQEVTVEVSQGSYYEEAPAGNGSGFVGYTERVAFLKVENPGVSTAVAWEPGSLLKKIIGAILGPGEIKDIVMVEYDYGSSQVSLHTSTGDVKKYTVGRVVVKGSVGSNSEVASRGYARIYPPGGCLYVAKLSGNGDEVVVRC